MKRDTTSLTSEELAQEVQKIQTEDISSYPSVFQMGRNVVKQGWLTAVGLAKGQPLLSSAEKAAARLEICKNCEFFDALPQRCKKCGCYMTAKANLEHSACPISKWGELQTLPVASNFRLQSGSTFPAVPEVSANLPSYSAISGSQAGVDGFIQKIDGSLLKNFTESEKMDFMYKYEATAISGSVAQSFKIRNITFTILEKQG